MSDVVIDICELKAKGYSATEITNKSAYAYLGLTESMVNQVIRDFYDPKLYRV